MERLYTPEEAGEVLRLHANDVRQLIRDRKLRGVHREVRGKGKRPRMFVLASDLERYMRELPAVGEAAERKPRGKRMPAGLRDEIAACVQYV